jgi:hypothetical protein
VYGELLICHLSIHIISFEDPLKKKEKKEKSKIKEKGVDFCVILLLGGVVISLCPGSRL